MGSNNLIGPSVWSNEQTSRNNNPSSHKSVKPPPRAIRRARSSGITVQHHERVTRSAGRGGRHPRVSRACERCRMKKVKCDSNFPCKRCKDDSRVCTISIKKKRDNKELSRGYAEAIESTQLVLIATIYKLYFMVRNNQPWELGEPDLNDYGQPVIHTIARKLDCIRLSRDIDLPFHGVFPDNEAGMAELVLELEEQQEEEVPGKEATEEDFSVSNRTERASPSELDHSDVECDYPKAVSENATTQSVQNFTDNTYSATFDPLSLEMDDLAWYPSQPFSTPNYLPWLMFTTVEPGDLALQSLQESDVVGGMNMVGRGLKPASDTCFTREFA